MSRLHFKYSMKLFYSEPVNPCHFTIKCIPRETARQKLCEINIGMDPLAKYTYGYDGFTNQKIVGSVRAPHDHFYLDVDGVVSTTNFSYEEMDDVNKVGMYKYPYGKTKAGEKLKSYKYCLDEMIESRGISTDYDKAVCAMEKLYDDFIYDVSATDVNTTAEEAITLGRGVCQDYAHIYVSILKMMGIPARYVVGLMLGEGKSHAWAEAYIDGKWVGFDPTNKHVVDENYIKIGHGRDALDCKINLGIMYGGGDQHQEIDVKVWKE